MRDIRIFGTQLTVDVKLIRGLYYDCKSSRIYCVYFFKVHIQNVLMDSLMTLHTKRLFRNKITSVRLYSNNLAIFFTQTLAQTCI